MERNLEKDIYTQLNHLAVYLKLTQLCKSIILQLKIFFCQQETGLNVFCLFVCFLGPHPQHMEGPSLGVELEL